MAFTTLPFLVFFAILFVLYYLPTWIPFLKGKGVQKWLILIANLVFYAWASPYFLIFLGASSLVVYGASLLFGRIDKKTEAACASLAREEKKRAKEKAGKKKKGILVLALLLVLLLLIVPKYASFFLENLNAVLGAFGVETNFKTSLILPLGLSFYTFQNIGYLVNVYWGKYPPQKNYFLYLTYISYFPHVLQGPLDEYEELFPALCEEHEFCREEAEKGLLRVLWGLFKKWAVATQIGLLISPYLSGEAEALGLTVVFCAVGYAVQMYADFSGYMDIAIGCSKLLGIPLAENFDAPYFSTGVAEYWRRWHITLGAWFRSYVYYPLMRSKGLSALRKRLKKHKYLASVLPTSLALALVWLCIGFWHGADWAYVLHGVYHGLFVISASVLEPLYSAYHKKFPKLTASVPYRIFCILRTFAIVCFGYLLFATGDVSLSFTLIGNLFAEGGAAQIAALFTGNESVFFSAGLGILLMLIVDVVYELTKKKEKKGLKSWQIYLLWILLGIAILLFGAYSEADASQFLYFRF